MGGAESGDTAQHWVGRKPPLLHLTPPVHVSMTAPVESTMGRCARPWRGLQRQGVHFGGTKAPTVFMHPWTACTITPLEGCPATSEETHPPLLIRQQLHHLGVFRKLRHHLSLTFSGTRRSHTEDTVQQMAIPLTPPDSSTHQHHR